MAPTFRLALITAAATLAYLGLAILGWGGFAAFFSHSALIALTIVLFALSGVIDLSSVTVGKYRPISSSTVSPTSLRFRFAGSLI
jgi:hypothetical protein